jgi:Got1/Sft2-like family
MSFAVSDMRKIGIGLTAFGLAFTGLGVVMLFDKGMLAMGNVLFLAGVMMIIGPQRSVRFFFQKKKARGSLFFFAGMALVLVGVPIIGMAAEAWGFVNLFGDFFPIAISFLRRLPVVGNLLSIPPVKQVRIYVYICLGAGHPSRLLAVRTHIRQKQPHNNALPHFPIHCLCLGMLG